MKTLEYFAPPFTSIDEVIAVHGVPQDATTLEKIATCPRKHEERVQRNLTKGGIPAKMQAGISLHEGLEFYYSHADRTPEVEERAIALVEVSWDSAGLDRGKMDKKEVHLTGQHLAQILRNYFQHWNRTVIEIYQPIAGLTLDKLNLSQVLAARFRLNEHDEIMLGESNLVMTFPVQGETLVLAGKPDLPVENKNTGHVYSMDHKTTGSYLSDYWAKTYEVSNKDRGYMAMMEALLGREVKGTIINGIYTGASALSEKSNATRFDRYSYDFSPDQVQEALKNQWAWKKTIEFYRDTLGYFPQGCGYGGCACPDLCKRDPAEREEVRRTDYEQSTRTFWSL